jgi:ankyrin repeat protein
MIRRSLLQALAVGTLCAWGTGAHAGAFEDFQTAIIRDDFVTMRKLLQRGMDPNTVDERGVPGLVKALHLESTRVAQMLLQAPGVQLDLASPQGETPLMQAAIKGQLPMVQALLARGVRVNQPGWSALHYAASADQTDSVAIAALLLEHHAYIDAESPNQSTPLMLAAQYGSQAMVNLLLNEGADVQLRNQQGLSALDFAQRSDRDFMVRLLDTASRATRRAKGSW